MTLYDLILGYGGARAQLEENATEYYWSLQELTAYFNKAEREAAQRSYCLKYRHSDDIIGSENTGLAAKVADTICGLTITANIAEYETNYKVISIDRARLASEEIPLIKVTRKQIDQINSGWMDSANSADTPEYYIAEIGHEIILYPVPSANDTLYLIVSVLPRYNMAVPQYGDDISFTAATKRITQTAGTFITNGYTAGAKITVSGATNSGNNRVFTISAVTSETVLTVTETVVEEAAGQSVIISSVPEIPEQYHEDLIDYVCYLALKKRGKQTQDMKKAADHLALFASVFGPKKLAGIEEAIRTTPMEGGMLAKKYRI